MSRENRQEYAGLFSSKEQLGHCSLKYRFQYHAIVARGLRSSMLEIIMLILFCLPAIVLTVPSIALDLASSLEELATVVPVQ